MIDDQKKRSRRQILFIVPVGALLIFLALAAFSDQLEHGVNIPSPSGPDSVENLGSPDQPASFGIRKSGFERFMEAIAINALPCICFWSGIGVMLASILQFSITFDLKNKRISSILSIVVLLVILIPIAIAIAMIIASNTG